MAHKGAEIIGSVTAQCRRFDERQRLRAKHPQRLVEFCGSAFPQAGAVRIAGVFR